MLNASNLDNGYAELMYRADILGYKESFASFCHINHYQIVKDSIRDMVIPTSAYAFSPESEIGYDVASDYIKGA
jgi:adenylate cyclase